MAPKCDGCGRFYRWQEPGSSWCFVPSTYISYEEQVDYCRACTEKLGPPAPSQSVDVEMCCGIYGGRDEHD